MTPVNAGAIALHNGRLQRVEDMPVSGKEIDAAILADVFEELLQGRDRPDMVVIERQQAFPGNAATGNFIIGQRYGVLLGSALPRLAGQSRAAKGVEARRQCRGGEGRCRARASELMPEAVSLWRLKKDHGRAEAALLAWYGAHKLPQPHEERGPSKRQAQASLL